ncbi:MAG: ATP-binding protein [Ginsengibacter sp.]
MKYFFVFLIFFPVIVIAQESNVFKLSSRAVRNTELASGWISLDSGWKFKAGDNADWAMPGFDDSSWPSINLFQDLYNVPEIPKNGIIWFRLRLTTDSTFNQQLVMRICQTGASEVYLEGKRIHALGVVSSDPSLLKYYTSNKKSLSFPLVQNTEQTLAMRFANSPSIYPISPDFQKSFVYVWISSLDNASEDPTILYDRTFNNRLNVGIGVAVILCVLYLSFFFFFPTEKINLYFSISNFFFALYLITGAISLNYHGKLFDLIIPSITFLTIYLLLLLYCAYKIFNRKPGWIYWILFVAGILAIPSVLLLSDNLIGTFLGILVLMDMMRISIKSLKTNKTGALIILIGMAIDLTFWTVHLLSMLSVITLPSSGSYIPFAILIAPLSLAIYLGNSFAKTSQSLRQKLAEVEQLSNEKQHILSVQNETLEKQVQERTKALNQSLESLKSTQAQLIQAEKMASLGELTAGIAHEIQNPLNFVNNFSEVNKELITEMKLEIYNGNIQEVKAIANDIEENEQKINHHGKRADAIVKGMLQHSRISSGQKERTDINALADEYLRLTYYGLSAKDKSFHATLQTDFDSSIEKLNIVPQDIGRVLLNLYNNAFYSVTEKMKLQPESYEPTVSVSTKKINGKVEIKIRDNGNGIPQNMVDKIFQPFFTTKPTGQGTGLGLSLSYDIVKAHGGEIKVESKEGKGAEFTLSISSNT